ncbi:hypothetical protein BC943DRAFT_275800 [Umbelopsis sp. AD052]|nr:hypothetical protein BC943DRAFT_275800 [Umbelopsis sp. AD052]
MADKKDDFDFLDIELEEKDLKPEEYTCNATQAFDAVFQCYTLGEQAINYYRYGEKKDCSGKWDYFKLCISTKTKSPLHAKVRWYELKLLDEHKAKTEEEKKTVRSSEDVWTLKV